MDKKYHKIYSEKAKALVAEMTLEEKVSQLCSESPAIERLGIPAYHWWNEGLHGVARAGTATMFPQAIGMAATFDKESLKEMGRITGLEGRIKYNEASSHGDRSIYKGISFWSPNINIYRDPRWGRGHETFGEDPVLTAICAENYIKGMQNGEDDSVLLAAACVKHLAAHSGPEGIRHGFDSKVSDFDLYDTYLPAFEWSIKKADVEGVMGAYNMINGVHSCGNQELMTGLLREKWGFDGYYVSDCGALADMHMFCLITHTAVESAALALKSGCDLNCGQVYLHVLEAYHEGMVTEDEIDSAVQRLIATRMKLGLLLEGCSYDKLTDYKMVECQAHRDASYQAAAKSIVLLKNNGILPLNKKQIKTIGVIGPNAASIRALQGNYNGTASRYHTVLSGIQDFCEEDVRVLYGVGCPLYQDVTESCAFKRDGFSEAKAVAENSDVVVMVMGLDSSIEGEQGDANNEYGAGDKEQLCFPGLQQELMEEIKKVGKPMILVVMAGGALDLKWAAQHTDAILYAWYPGSEGGRAIADILFGAVNPSGRTPVTFYQSVEDIPAFEDYSMRGRTYRYLNSTPLYPFGFGLSYTSFSHKICRVSGCMETGFSVLVSVKNIGEKEGEEVVSVYAEYQEERYITPNCKFCAFERVFLKPGEEKKVLLSIEPEAIMLTDINGERYFPEKSISFYTGDSLNHK